MLLWSNGRIPHCLYGGRGSIPRGSGCYGPMGGFRTVSTEVEVQFLVAAPNRFITAQFGIRIKHLFVSPSANTETSCVWSAVVYWKHATPKRWSTRFDSSRHAMGELCLPQRFHLLVQIGSLMSYCNYYCCCIGCCCFR